MNSMQSFFKGIVDYAGLFPPAKLPMDEALKNFARYQKHPQGGMMGAFVVPIARLGEVDQWIEARKAEGQRFDPRWWRFSILTKAASTSTEFRKNLCDEREIVAKFSKKYVGELQIIAVEMTWPQDITATVHSVIQPDVEKITAGDPAIFDALRAFSGVGLAAQWELYCEVPWNIQNPDLLMLAIASTNRTSSQRISAKIRTGGLTPEAVPNSAELSRVIHEAAKARVGVKFTAGLHQPLPNFNPQVGAQMHGFVNVFTASMLAQTHNIHTHEIEAVLRLEGSGCFVFDGETLKAGPHTLTRPEMVEGRQKTMSFGTCSFDEPVEFLEKYNLLPQLAFGAKPGLDAISANDPQLKSWVHVPEGSDFPIQNLPFGVFRTHVEGPRVGVAIGDHVLDLGKLVSHGELLADIDYRLVHALKSTTLNGFLGLGKSVWRRTRNRISEILRMGSHWHDKYEEFLHSCLLEQSRVEMLLPIAPRDYVDFYSSEEHARNVGIMFRDPNNPLLPNWKHIPIGYHGRSASLVVSGTDVRRPLGQLKSDAEPAPQFLPSQQMDFELEMAFLTDNANPLGGRLHVTDAEDHIFGLCLFNDWSARDIQRWEYVPLGPFLGKSFASTLSPWVVTLDALEPFRCQGPQQDVPVLPHLDPKGASQSFDIALEVWLKGSKMERADRISLTNFKHMYWSMAQQLTHMASNGSAVQAGDVYASGTISGPTPDSLGSMLELCWKGTRPVKLSDGSERKFLKDGDVIEMRGYAQKGGVRVGFGAVTGKILPALPMD